MRSQIFGCNPGPGKSDELQSGLFNCGCDSPSVSDPVQYCPNPSFQIRIRLIFWDPAPVQNLRIRKIRNKSKKESYATVNVENVQALQLQNLGLTVGDGSHVSQLPYCRYLRYRNIKVQYRYLG